MKTTVVRPALTFRNLITFLGEFIFGVQLQDKQFDFELVKCYFFITKYRYLEGTSILSVAF